MGCSVSHQTFYSRDAHDGFRHYATIQNDYFAKGGVRYAFKGTLHGKGPQNNKECVVKIFQEKVSDQLSAVRPDKNASIKAKHFAVEFQRICSPRLKNLLLEFEIEFVLPLIATMKRLSGVATCGLCMCREDDRYFRPNHYVLIEPFIHGNFEKFNSNGGWEGGDELMTAFCHWTWHSSRGKYMICHLQGVKCGRKYILTDPVFHSSVERTFGDTDLGEYGMVMVLTSHTCNKLCRKVGLNNPYSRFRSTDSVSFEVSKRQSKMYYFQVSRTDLVLAKRIIKRCTMKAITETDREREISSVVAEEETIDESVVIYEEADFNVNNSSQHTDGVSWVEIDHVDQLPPGNTQTATQGYPAGPINAYSSSQHTGGVDSFVIGPFHQLPPGNTQTATHGYLAGTINAASNIPAYPSVGGQSEFQYSQPVYLPGQIREVNAGPVDTHLRHPQGFQQHVPIYYIAGISHSNLGNVNPTMVGNVGHTVPTSHPAPVQNESLNPTPGQAYSKSQRRMVNPDYDVTEHTSGQRQTIPGPIFNRYQRPVNDSRDNSSNQKQTTRRQNRQISVMAVDTIGETINQRQTITENTAVGKRRNLDSAVGSTESKTSKQTQTISRQTINRDQGISNNHVNDAIGSKASNEWCHCSGTCTLL